MRILSWNVNGLRACERKGFIPWLERCDAEVVGLQEVRALSEQLSAPLREPESWHFRLSTAEKKGYSGVGLYSRRAPDQLETSLGQEELDAEGRLQLASFGALTIANVYFPNGNGRNRDNSRIPYKLGFYQRLFEKLEDALEPGSKRRVLVMGDFNTAHEAIDLARPKQNVKTSGFRPEERAELSRWLEAGWQDTFRARHPGEEGHYTWWSQRSGARERNVGWRIDYVLASPAATPFVRDAFILPEVLGSDHCPLGVEVDPSILLA